jgi:hypothetical protein
VLAPFKTVNCKRVHLVILGMAADEPDERDLGAEIKGNDQSERVVGDLEANALCVENLRARKRLLHIIRRFPIHGLARHMVPVQ